MGFKDTILFHAIDIFLRIDLKKDNLEMLSAALLYSDDYLYHMQEMHIILFKLNSLKNSSRLAEVFSAKNLSSEQEKHIIAIARHKLDSMIKACEESLTLERADFVDHFGELCGACINIRGNFDPKAFNKALRKQLGIYNLNADRLTELAVQAFDAVRRKPLDLPSIGTAKRMTGLSGQQIVDSLLDELKKQLIRSAAEAHVPPGFRAGFDRLTQAVQRRSQILQEKQQNLGQPDDSVDEEEIAQLLQQLQTELLELPRLQEQLHELYADLIFNQWRRIGTALGAIPAEQADV